MFELNTLNNSMFNAARDSGESTRVIVELISKNKTSKKVLAALGDAFKLGRIAGYLKLKDADAADKVMSMKPFIATAKDTDDRRSPAQHKAVRAAISAWSHVCGLAGVENKRNGKARAAKGAKVESTAKDTISGPKNAPTILPVRAAKTYEDAKSFALQLRDAIVRFENLSAQNKVQLGDLGTILREFCDKVHALKDAPAKAA